MMESEVGELVLMERGWHTRYRFAQTSTSGGEIRILVRASLKRVREMGLIQPENINIILS